MIWDDRCTMHRGMDFDDQRYARDMRRATVSDVAPTCEQMGLAVAARMTPAAFASSPSRSRARTEGAHGGHPDFRAGGKVFASLGYPDMEWAMVKLAPEQQQMLVSAEPAMFVPVKGTWGLRGATRAPGRGRCAHHAQRAHHGLAERDCARLKPKKARRAGAIGDGASTSRRGEESPNSGSGADR